MSWGERFKTRDDNRRGSLEVPQKPIVPSNDIGYTPEQQSLLPDDPPLELWKDDAGFLWCRYAGDTGPGLGGQVLNLTLQPGFKIAPPSRYTMDARWNVLGWQGTREACEATLERIVLAMRDPA